jgi:acetyl-CoA C-acetyltransferase
VICRKDIAAKFNPDYVVIKGLGLSVGPGTGRMDPTYDFVHFPETIRASQQAYQQAGITNPFTELSLAEVHDCFTITELLIYEDLGFVKKGEAKPAIDDGVFTLEGELPVNTDGGLKSFGHPIGASGLRMLYEIYKQLQGKAGARQVKKAELGLAHNLGGLPGSFTCSVVILGR